MPEALKTAIGKALESGLPVDYADPVAFDRKPGMSMGSRSHPGPAADRKIAKTVVITVITVAAFAESTLPESLRQIGVDTFDGSTHLFGNVSLLSPSNS